MGNHSRNYCLRPQKSQYFQEAKSIRVVARTVAQLLDFKLTPLATANNSPKLNSNTRPLVCQTSALPNIPLRDLYSTQIILVQKGASQSRLITAIMQYPFKIRVLGCTLELHNLDGCDAIVEGFECALKLKSQVFLNCIAHMLASPSAGGGGAAHRLASRSFPRSMWVVVYPSQYYTITV